MTKARETLVGSCVTVITCRLGRGRGAARELICRDARLIPRLCRPCPCSAVCEEPRTAIFKVELSRWSFGSGKKIWELQFMLIYLKTRAKFIFTNSYYTDWHWCPVICQAVTECGGTKVLWGRSGVPRGSAGLICHCLLYISSLCAAV